MYTGGISTHAPARGATAVRALICHGPVYFNPRSCTRSDAINLKLGELLEISTHAPARGATRNSALERMVLMTISTHAPARGATIPVICDVEYGAISTHAPARGATMNWNGISLNGRISTHAPARGATLTDADNQDQLFYFNPRSCTRSDTVAFISRASLGYFNPRSCTRSDARSLRALACSNTISTHAPARGATVGAARRISPLLFQPTLLHEERPGSCLVSA